MGRFKQFPFTKITDVQFKLYSDEEIAKLSVVKITNEESINSLGHYLQDGVYDLRMGPMSAFENEICKTCFSGIRGCSGHCGHISLPVLIYNPFLVKELEQLLRRICHHCCKFQITAPRALQYIYQCKLLSDGYVAEALEIADLIPHFSEVKDEAFEVDLDVDEKAIKKKSEKLSNEESAALALKLKKNLESYYKQVKEKRPSDKATTYSTRFAYQKVFKRVQLDTKQGTSEHCRYCKLRLMNLHYENSQMTIRNSQKLLNQHTLHKHAETLLIKSNQPYLTPEQAQIIIRKCWESESSFLIHLYPVLDRSDMKYPTDLFFMQNLLVPPPKFRPCNKMDGFVVEHDMSVIYKTILKITKCMRFLVLYKYKEITDIPENIQFLIKEFQGESLIDKFHTVWRELQKTVSFILDTDLKKNMSSSAKGIRQLIEKKEGLFRQNLMGKRVNYTARSVAAPDPMLGVDEVGIPNDFAIKLTYPVPVNSHNVHELRELVINGPDKHPGAIMVEDEEGRKVTIKTSDVTHRTAIANSLLTSAESCVNKLNASKIVHRHLKTGDWVLMNRQPTLHRPSIQAHKVRVLPSDRVLRMPYANCKAYNADFDGDELNLHFPQNEMARSECLGLITTQNQYLTPKDGTPLAGLIQDCVVSSVTLSKRGVFFNKADYQQLVYVGISELHRGKIKFLPPTIIKPKVLWSGKQIFSTILHNLIEKEKAKPTMTFKTSVKVDLWQVAEPRPCQWGGDPETRNVSMTESEFILRDGELLCGIVDKCAIGSTSHGLIHTCHDLYGGKLSTNLLSAIGRMCVWFLQWSGHTISLKEFVTPANVSLKRRLDLENLIKRTPKEVGKKLDISVEELPEFIKRYHNSKNETEMALIDAAYTSVLGPTTSRVTSENEKGLYRNNLNNRMRMMVDTGAKGSKVNMNQMASLFGSVALDGKRMAMSITGKTLPSFKPYDTSPRAGGYIPTRFVSGMDPKSYFFLCVVGRDSLQHTAVKTSNSGYTQRCLIKHLEGLKVCYDQTVRNSDMVVIQFDYGEDGLDVTKVPFLNGANALNTLVDNYSRLISDDSIQQVNQKNGKIKKHKKKIANYKLKAKLLPKERTSGFLNFCKDFCNKSDENDYEESVINASALAWHKLSKEERMAYESTVAKCPEPVSAKYRYMSSSSLEVVTEALDDLIESYYQETYSKRPLAEQFLSQKEVAKTIRMKVLNSRVEPGEPVGALCAQALGEPLTQMTLNTFHFAGRDELNVTLGVPRMREILQMAAGDTMLTPIMECPFRPHISLSKAEALKKLFNPVALVKVVHKVNIEWSLEKQYKMFRRTVIEFRFVPHSEYKKVLPLTPKKILEFMEGHYISKVLLHQIVLTLHKADSFGNHSSFKKSTKNAKEADESEDIVDVDNKLGEESDEEGNSEELEDLGIAASKWRENGEEKDYSENEDEIEGSLTENEDEIEAAHENSSDDDVKNVNVKLERKGSDDEGFVDEKHEEQRKAGINSVNKKQKRVKQTTSAKPSMSVKQCRVNQMTAKNGWIEEYDYDEEKMEWCKVTLALPIAEGKYDLPSILRDTIENTLIHSVPNIKKALVVQNNGGTVLRTEGVNINYILRYENYLDVNRLYTNNIHIMGRMFGIEAAQRSIIKEIRAVQSAYDIKVDFRHLSLLADYFTCEGVYQACSRHHLSNCSSPIQKMSYETCFAFLKEALLQGHCDNMTSPSASVMVGQPVQVGTNAMFDVLCKLNTSCIK